MLNSKNTLFFKQVHFILFLVCVLTLNGCDQIKDRLINSNKNTAEKKNTIGNNKNLSLEKNEDNSTNLNSKQNVLSKDNNNKTYKKQMQLLRKNSEEATNKNSYSVIGIERGKPFRNSGSDTTSTD